jgi:hypothetical protein
MSTPVFLGSTRYVAPASDGGHGSYAFDDTTVFGNRDFRSVILGGSQFLLPGQGGGATPHYGMSFGSTGGRGSPHGAVVVRLSTAL